MEHTKQQTVSDSNQLSLLQDLASCDTVQTRLPTSYWYPINALDPFLHIFPAKPDHPQHSPFHLEQVFSTVLAPKFESEALKSEWGYITQIAPPPGSGSTSVWSPALNGLHSPPGPQLFTPGSPSEITEDPIHINACDAYHFPTLQQEPYESYLQSNSGSSSLPETDGTFIFPTIWETDRNVGHWQLPNPEHRSDILLPSTSLDSGIFSSFEAIPINHVLHTFQGPFDDCADSAALSPFSTSNDKSDSAPGIIGPQRHNLKSINGSQSPRYRRDLSDGRTVHGSSPYPSPQAILHVDAGRLPDVSDTRGEYSEGHDSGIPLNAQRRPTESESNFQCPVPGCAIALNKRLNLTEHLVRFHSNSVGGADSNLGLNADESNASLSSHDLAASSARDSSITNYLQDWLKVHDCTQIDDFLYLARTITSVLEHKSMDCTGPMYSELSSLVDQLYKMLQPGNMLKDERQIDHLLTRVVKVTGLLPSSIVIKDVTRNGSNPVAGGGFADVWKGKQGDIDVAMKVLRIFGEGELSKRVLRAFCSEVLVWHRLRHSNVMPFLGLCETEFAPRYALISPWMKNGHMLEYLEKYPESNRRGMMLGVAMGMEYLHTMKPTVIHGDLRAPNILIDDNGQPRISDFGLAIFFDSKGGSLAQSSFRGQGSVWWQAPELLNPTRFSGIKPGLTTNSDVYAFACVCLEIFTGKAPFSNLTDLQVIMEVAVNDGRPPRPPQPAEERGLSDEVWSLIQECWAVQPADRPSMTAVRAHIENITTT